MIYNLYHNSQRSNQKSDNALPEVLNNYPSPREIVMNQGAPSREYFSIEMDDEESKSIYI